MSKPNYKQARSEAGKILREMHITSPVVSVFDVAEREGIKIVFFKPNEKLKDVAGFYDPDEKIIYVNEKDSTRNQFFTIAHELGHYKLDHEPKKYGVLMRWYTAEKNVVEKEADEFAKHLLVPPKMLNEVRKEYKLSSSDLDIELLSRLFGVPNNVISMRIKGLRIASWKV